MARRQVTSFVVWTAVLAFLTTAAVDAAKIEDFIPDDSIAYLTLRDLDEVWHTVEASDNWKVIWESPQIVDQMNEVNQGLNFVKLMLGVDLPRLVEVFGHQAALALLSAPPDLKAGIIIHTGGAISEVERIINGLAQLASGEQGGQPIEPESGQYRKVHFTTIHLDAFSLSYGFVDDFLVVGVNSGGFEALIDTYKKQRPSLIQNQRFAQVQKQFETSQIFSYANIDAVLPLLTRDMSADKLREFRVLGLDSLQTLAYGVDVLDVGGGLSVYAQMKPTEHRSGLLRLLLQEGQPLKSIQALSGEEDVFLSIAPPSADAIWQFIEFVGTTSDDSGGFHAGIAQVESFLNLNIKNDVIGALTGELALWGNFTDLMREGISEPVDLLYAIDAAVVGGLKNPAKWQIFLDSIQNLANMPLQQYDYKGTTLHKISIPPEAPTVTARYGFLKDLFLVTFSDERFESVVDNAQKANAAPAFKKALKRYAADPIVFLQLKLDKLLPATMDADLLPPDAAKQLEPVGPVVGAIAVKGDEAWLTLGTLSDEMAIEAYGRIAAAMAGVVGQ